MSTAPMGDKPATPLTPFGKYFLVRKLAEGGMAEIFLAKLVGAEGFERDVVIKRMLSNLSSSADFVTMFLDEARLAARLAHPNIVQIHDLGQADGSYYICMEYLAGEDFSTVLRTASKQREYVPMGVVLRVIIDAAHGLHFAHEFADEPGRSLNIVHRDISPSNIYVTYLGQVKVLDFGIAKAESRATQTTAGVVKGKYMYMAPEQARGLPVDRRADIFALGVSLYEALTNTRPFARDADLAILNAVLTGDFPPPRELRPEIPPDLEAVVLKAMAAGVEDRYQTMGEMAADLERILAATPISNAQVASYLRGLFGEERIVQRTRIPTLVSLSQASGLVQLQTLPQGQQMVTADDLSTTLIRPQEKPTLQLQVRPPPEEANRRDGRRQPGWALLARGLALGALVAGAALGVMRILRPPPPQVVVVTTPPPPAPSAPQETPPPPQASPTPEKTPEPPPQPPVGDPPVDAGMVVAAADPPPGGGQDEPVEVSSPPPSKPSARPVVLDAEGIQKIVNKGRGPILACFESFKGELPGDEGQVGVSFTILSSGKVARVQVGNGFDGTRVGRCLEQRVARLRFPAHKDKEITLSLPFAYRVQR